ncbi:CD48 antigen-like [Platichthys flesus]|uniref:CD48 antigen-like n=1 Tax=Platichthys flesus TaxID=8260 RepID=UPI002DB82EED|nr:CD48 antigen-like [Platichthys flesus]
MDGHSSSGPVTVLLLAALTSSALGQDPLYFEEGKPLVLTPPKHGTVITSVVWTHNTDLVVEWVNNVLELYRSFKGRTELDQSTAQLTVNNPKQNDGGEYRVEINNELQSQVYTVKVIKKVTKPSVKVRTLTCGPTSSKCNFSCWGDTAGTQPLTYSWRKDSGEWEPEQQSMDLIFNDTKTKRVKEISCRMKNPISEEESDPLPNPMYNKGLFSQGELAAVICSPIIVVLSAGLGLLIDT